MTIQTRRRWVPWLPVVLVLALVPAVGARTPPTGDRSLFVAALDESGKPVLDLTADDFRLREDGVDRVITSVKPAAQPLQVALLADTTLGSRVSDHYGTVEDYTHDIRLALISFVKALTSKSPDVSIELMEFGQAAITVVPFSMNPIDLEKGINRLVAKANVGSVLLEALVQANNDLAARPSTRRAVVTLNLEPSDEQSQEQPKHIVETFKKSGAQLWSVSIQRGTLGNPKHDVVLNELAKTTGGQRDFIVGISAIETMLKNYADILASQYEVTYTRPESKKPTQVVQVGTTRQGIKLHASGFATQ